MTLLEFAAPPCSPAAAASAPFVRAPLGPSRCSYRLVLDIVEDNK